jgi:hypothetical protein
MRCNRWLWLVLITIGGVDLSVNFFNPSALWATILLVVSCGVAVAAIFYGIHLYHPQPAAAWYLIGFGQIFNMVGDLFFAQTFYLGNFASFESWSETAYFLGSLSFVAGLLIFFGYFRRLISRDALMNGLILAIGLAAAVYILRANPIVILTQYPQVWLNTIVYPLVLLSFLLVASIFLMTSLGDLWSYRFLYACILFYAAGQYFYGNVIALEGPIFPSPDFNLIAMTNGSFSAAYLFIGLALLHPSIQSFRKELQGAARKISWLDMLVLGVAFWIIPLTFVYQYLLNQSIDVLFVLGSMLVIFTLVQLRLGQLVQMLAAQNQLLNQQKALLQQQAYHDVLTGLPNRALLYRHLADAVSRAQTNGGVGAVFMIDFNQFKQVNDRFGHDQGDHALLEISKQLANQKRKTDLVAR